jgi:fructose-1,6-bisphosphatase/inositol monophosphatase family enzyme
VALGYFGTLAAEEKADGTAVTRLDREVSARVVRALQGHTPAYGVISEEEAQSYLPLAAWQWVVDPLDGTAAFARGYSAWGLGIGLMHGSDTVEGYMRFPVLNETFCFADGVGTLNGKPLSHAVPVSFPDTHNVLTTSTLHDEIPYDRLAGVKLRSFGSNLYHLGCLAAGRADAIICPSAYLWDIAAALPFTRALDMVEVELDGSPFVLERVLRHPQYRIERPLFIGRPAEVEQLVARLR